MQKLKKILTHKTFQLLLVLVFLTSVLVVTTFLRPDVWRNLFSGVQVLTRDVASGRLWKEKSQTRIYLEDGAVGLSFQITPEDQAALESFNQKLGVSDEYLTGLAFKLDPPTTEKLKPYLPLHLNLQVEADQISFQSGIVPGFASSLVSETKELATGEGKLRYTQYSQTQFALEISDPEPLLKYATASGQYVMSDKLLPLFPILDQIGTIKMSVNGKSVSGEVKLK